MMKKIFSLFMLAFLLFFSANASAAVADVQVGGWFEGGYVTWTKVAGQTYNVYVQSTSATDWTKLDDQLVREYPTYGRADALGLKAGSYRFKVVPVDKTTKAELADEATVTDSFVAAPYDRGGFAHFKTASSTFNPANGVGAYKNDGTLKDGAKVVYVYADNAATVTAKVKTGSKDTDITECVGFQNILDAYEKGQDKTPIDFRIIGTIKAENMDGFSSSAEGVQIKGRNSYSELNITIEGVGKDAAVHGFGFLIRNAASVEFRNFAIMWCKDDAVSMDTDNSNLWMHNLDLFYGKPGSAADQAKGDGTLDIKGDSKYSTLSYNHLWDSGKSSLCGMKSESGPNYITYHHNWFDHSDSRHPRIRTMTVHVYNNYYDGNSKYGIGATTGSDVFAENNYFRNCKLPMLTSKQGSDVHNGIGSSDDTKGTFSGENGGSIKAFGNYMTGHKSFEPYDAADATYSKHFDAYVASTREEKVPASMVALLGGDTYSNFDTNSDLMYTGYKVDEAKDVPAIVKGDLGAGRCQHGDFTWIFGANEDTNDKVIASLSTAIQNYKSTLVGFFNKAISNGGASGEQGGSSDEGNGGSGDNTGGGDGGGDDNTIVEEPYITGATANDYFLFNEENAEKVKAFLADGTIALQNGNDSTSVSKFDPKYSYDAAAAGKTFASTIYTGSLQLGKASAAGKTDGGAVVFRCNKGVTTFAAHMYRTGSVYLNIYTSTDSVKWTKVASVEKGASGIYEKNFSSAVMDTTHCVFIKIENTSTGGLNVQGVRILNLEGATVKEKTEPGTGDDDPTDNPGGTGEGDVSDALYKFTVKAIVPAAVEDGVAQNYSDAIETTGGKFIFGNVSKIAASTVSSTGFDYKMDGNASATNTKYVKIILDEALKLGDKISVTGSQTAGTPSASKIIGYSIYTDQAAAPLATLQHTKKGAEETITMDVTEAMVGVKEFMLVRYTGASVLFSGIEITGEKSAVNPGDVNGDGSVSVADLAAIASYILGENVDGFNTKAADVNTDGQVTVADLAAIASKILGTE